MATSGARLRATGTTNYFLSPYTSTALNQPTTGDVTNYAAAIDKSGNTWITGTGSGVNGSQLFMIAHGNPSGVPAVLHRNRHQRNSLRPLMDAACTTLDL